ncbi:hypothetical protein Q9L58_008437 [Maublancomyces gigas]|uniref:Uncharacterized protein n=1 Tax=Discina gigas TaxID=1032678 RepID=A0ABR3GA45_9PEZI
MKITAIYISSSIASVALALPVSQFNEPWSGFFGPDPGYYPYGVVNPYYPPQLQPPNGPNNQLPAPPPLLAPIPYGVPYEDPGAPLPPRPPQPPAPYPSAPAPGPFDAPQINRPSGPLKPPSLELPAPKSPTSKPKLNKPVSEKPRDKKPLANKFAPEFEDSPPPTQVHKPVVEDDSSSDDFDKDAIRYHVNVGGIQKGAGGGTTNFHVYSDENGNKRFSDELDEDTEKYITENMIPRLGGKKRGGNRGGVWSVFGDN